MEIFRTELCDPLGIEMVAAVGQAGGMEVLAGVGVPPDELRRQIRRVRELTDRPLGVNLLLHTEFYPPVDAATLSDSTVQAVQAVLNRFRRRLGLPESTTRPPSFPDFIDVAFEVILEQRVPIFSIGLGTPTPEMVRRCHEREIKVMAMASTVADAVELAETGVDLIVAQGSEAGGHRSDLDQAPFAGKGCHRHHGARAPGRRRRAGAGADCDE